MLGYMLNTTISIFPNITDLNPSYIKLSTAFERIKTGKSKITVEKIRTLTAKEEKKQNQKRFTKCLFCW